MNPLRFEQVDAVRAQPAQRFLEALDQTLARRVVERHAALGMVFARHVDTRLGDDLQLVTQPRRKRKRLAQRLLDLVLAVDLGRVDRRDALAIKPEMKIALQGLQRAQSRT